MSTPTSTALRELNSVQITQTIPKEFKETFLNSLPTDKDQTVVVTRQHPRIVGMKTITTPDGCNPTNDDINAFVKVLDATLWWRKTQSLTFHLNNWTVDINQVS